MPLGLRSEGLFNANYFLFGDNMNTVVMAGVDAMITVRMEAFADPEVAVARTHLSRHGSTKLRALRAGKVDKATLIDLDFNINRATRLFKEALVASNTRLSARIHATQLRRVD